jgi:hypothetical protein
VQQSLFVDVLPSRNMDEESKRGGVSRLNAFNEVDVIFEFIWGCLIIE